VPPVPSASSTSFVEFVARVTTPDLLGELARRTGLPSDELGDRVRMAAAESAQTLRVLAGLDVDPDDRILEVGAGLGLTSAYLSSRGFDVTGLEPGGTGFEENREVARQLAELAGWTYHPLPIGVADLEREHGPFSLIYSNNVLEHVDDLDAAFAGMARVMGDGGVMAHSCPNYSIPYEPHFGLPLLPVRPRWTARLLPRRVSSGPLWRSLNFVRARDVERFARDHQLDVAFRPGSLAASLERLGTDLEFRSRHRLLGTVAVALRRVGVLAQLRRLPPTWSTPMDFLLWRHGAGQPSRATWLARGAASPLPGD
jgi:SAM-dependent methyltransferase